MVDRLPHGLDTQLGPTWPDGAEVSFGQWQKLALARGFMRDEPLLLVLDEPTAALDAETEHALFERYAAASRTAPARRRSRCSCRHRFSTVRMADLIVVLDGASVVEVGSHAELMAAGGPYAELLRDPAARLPRVGELRQLLLDLGHGGVGLGAAVGVDERRHGLVAVVGRSTVSAASGCCSMSTISKSMPSRSSWPFSRWQ